MEHTNTKTIIEATSVSKVFHAKASDVVVLKKVDLAIQENDFAIIFGPSGCGKSTLLHIMLGLEPPTTGSLHFFNVNLYSYTEDERSVFRKDHIGMIYQQPNWIRSLSVVENVAFAASLLGETKERAKVLAQATLKRVGMLEWADYYPTELSSGQQQKVSLARALVGDPKVVIADEPTGNLDFQSGKELMELFKDLIKQGKTVIMVTHDINNVDYASKVVQMFDGQIVKVYDIAHSATSIKKILRDSDSDHIFAHIKPQETVAVPVKPEKKHARFPLKIPFSSLKTGVKIFTTNALQTLNFIGLLSVYLVQKMSLWLFRHMPEFVKKIARLNSIAPKVQAIYSKLFHVFGKDNEKTIRRVDLIDLSIKNILSKKTRTAITIGGMAIGIGSIVFLVSVGYGLEKLVVTRVARLEEMKQIDAIPAVTSNVKITDKSLAQFKDIPSVTKVLPVIGIVGQVSFKKSNTAVAVYGVVADYLKESAIKPVQGAIFTSNEIGNKVAVSKQEKGEVAGVSTEKRIVAYGLPIGETEFSINQDEWIRVREKPTRTAKIIGYTKRAEGIEKGILTWGGSYLTDGDEGNAGTDKKGTSLGLWIKTSALMWDSIDEKEHTLKKDTDGLQVQTEGYIAAVNMQVDTKKLLQDGQVLGIETDSATPSAEVVQEDLSDIEIASLSAQVQKQNIKTVTFAQKKKREAVVNRSFLQVLGITETQAIGKTFSISFIATEDLTQKGEKAVSTPIDYTIIGVIPDSDTPIVYVPLSDTKELGLAYYSQVKLIVSDQSAVSQTRKQVEALGMKTASVVDTVAQINRLFGTFRLVLGLLGIVALAVAALGMFNTLTISLLERTREVGMMKAIGMQSTEVRDLFLTESMIMGFFGGIGGLLLGFLAGKVTSLVLSLFAIIKGVGLIDITYIPVPFVLLIVFLSITVGVITGMYPAYRATKISALDALRYE